MGSGGSVGSKRLSPDEAERKKRREAVMNRHYDDNDERASQLYKCCKSRDINGVREFLSKSDANRYKQLRKLEPNGDSALHVAVRNRDIEIIKLLFENNFPRNLWDRNGQYAVDLAVDPSVKKLFERNSNSRRFADEYVQVVSDVYDPQAKIESTGSVPSVSVQEASTVDQTASTGERTGTFFHHFKEKQEIEDYLLDYQTMAMWLKAYKRLQPIVGIVVRHDNFRADLFDLSKNADFQYFMSKRCKPEEAEKTRDAVKELTNGNGIKPIIEMYTDDKACFRPLNQQLAGSEDKHEETPHLCDRLIMEFHIRSDELKRYQCTGTIYRGTNMERRDINNYKQVARKENGAIISFRAFTSTSKLKEIAEKFMISSETSNNRLKVLFVIDVAIPSTNIISIEDLSQVQEEKEVLILPGTLFEILEVEENCRSTTESGEQIEYTEIRLKYHHVSVSVLSKLRHTYRSSKTRVV